MERRIEIDPERVPVCIPGRVLNEICAHAVEVAPEECCGLVIGAAEERFQTVVRCRNEMTQRHSEDPQQFPRDGREAFWMNPMDYARAQEQADAHHQTVNAVYHSHVGFGVYLSELDIEFAEHETFPFPDADHIVISVLDGRVRDFGIFRREGQGDAFVGAAIEPAAVE